MNHTLQVGKQTLPGIGRWCSLLQTSSCTTCLDSITFQRVSTSSKRRMAGLLRRSNLKLVTGPAISAEY